MSTVEEPSMSERTNTVILDKDHLEGIDPARIARCGMHAVDAEAIAENYYLCQPHMARRLAEVVLAYYHANRGRGNEDWGRLGTLASDLRMIAHAVIPGYGDELAEIRQGFAADFEDEYELRTFREAAAAKARRRAKQRIPRRLRKAVFDRDDYCCVKCSSRFEIACDHIHPESKGGPTTFENLRTLCKSCNSRKGANFEAEAIITQTNGRAPGGEM